MNKNMVIEALKIIRKLCEEATDCSVCPLRCNHDECTLEKVCPQDWLITEDNWKAFK